MMKQQFLSILFICVISILKAQTHEVGFFIGGANYIGDIGKTNYILPNKLSGGLIYKYNLNPRMALRGTYTYLPISADDADASNPYRQERGIRFTNTIHEFAAGLEYNFFEYNTSNYHQKFNPYILVEAAAFSYQKPTVIAAQNVIRYKSTTSYAIPFGIGVKGRLTDNLAYAIEAKVRYTFIDNLDVPDNFNEINPNIDYKGNGNDWYTFTGVSIVYTFGRPPCYADIR